MRVEKILAAYQRNKEITRLGNSGAIRRFFAGVAASLCRWRVYLQYRLFFRHYPEPLDGSGDIIVSLTTYPARIGRLWMVIDLLMRQTVRPAEIVLNLYEGDFPDRKLPDSLLPYIYRGLTVLWCPENLKPHLKYHYVFLREADTVERNVVTVDDDLFYAPDTVERLANLHKRFPDAVCANIARRITDNRYSRWRSLNKPSGPSKRNFALGFGGVLYPASFYREAGELYDRETVRKICLGADDLWLKHIESKVGVGVTTGSFMAVPPAVPFSQKTSLSSENVARHRNDKIWRRLQRP